MKVPKLSIIVVNYKTTQLTLEALRSVCSDVGRRSYEVVVFDNASGDGFEKKLKSIYGNKIYCITSIENVGFACANNEAVKFVTGEYLLLLNPDTVVLDSAIDKLLHFAQQTPEALIWGGRTLFKDGTLNPSSCWKKQTLWSLLCQALGLTSLFRKSSLFNFEGMGGWDRLGVRKVDIVSGCFLLIKHDVWKKLGGFHSDFFMYGEEADLCLRAKKMGAKPMVTSDATIIHYGGASEKNRPDKLVRLIKSKLLLIRRHFTPFTVSFGVVLLSCWPLTRYAAHSILCFMGYRKCRKSKEIWKQVWRRRKEWLEE